MSGIVLVHTRIATRVRHTSSLHHMQRGHVSKQVKHRHMHTWPHASHLSFLSMQTYAQQRDTHTSKQPFKPTHTPNLWLMNCDKRSLETLPSNTIGTALPLECRNRIGSPKSEERCWIVWNGRGSCHCLIVAIHTSMERTVPKKWWMGKYTYTGPAGQIAMHRKLATKTGPKMVDGQRDQGQGISRNRDKGHH